jgi:predicted DNA-binding protein (MmcQ/YjbR family)
MGYPEIIYIALHEKKSIISPFAFNWYQSIKNRVELEEFMKLNQLKEYLMKKPGTAETYPFGEIPICYKVSGKIYAELYPSQDNYKITLKCEPMLADFYRQQYKDAVVRGYHCPPIQQPYKNTVYIDIIDEKVLLDMIDHSYNRVLEKLTQNEYKLGIITREQVIAKGGIYIETIQEGFEYYQNSTLTGTEKEIYHEIHKLREKNGVENSFVDFYYGKLTAKERDNLRSRLSDESISILNRFEYLKQPVYITLDDEILYLTAELNAKEILFSTYYFCKHPCTVWGNYNRSYPVFSRK